MEIEDTGIWLGVQGIEISFPDIIDGLKSADIDSVSITIKDVNDKENTLTKSLLLHTTQMRINITVGIV